MTLAPDERSLPGVTDALAWRSINAVRALSMDAVEKAQSGHPGTPMALAPVAYVLWTRFLRHHPQQPDWPDRDRFILSCGHASMLLYSLLHLSGYDLPLEELVAFRQWNSRTPGHPERGHTPGVETTTGPLGQGVGNAVGMALAERYLAQRFNRPEQTVVDHRVWALVSDGDLMEGVASEAASLAGHLRLAKLTLIYDDNRITIDGTTSLAFTEDVGRRFEAYGWRVSRVEDGNDLAGIAAALDRARHETERPTLIVLRTHIADPAPTKRDTSAAHGAPLGTEEVRRTKEIMGWPTEPAFFVPEDARAHWRESVDRGATFTREWDAQRTRHAAAHPELAAALDRALAGELSPGWDDGLAALLPSSGALATRQASALVIDALTKRIPTLIGGSADLAESTGLALKGAPEYRPDAPGQAVHWGVREHAMGACLNGIAAHGGLRPFGSTFLVFADYMKPSIRLAALMHLPVIYVFTHDSIGLGEDGPTHQPIEQLALLRAIPGMVVLRPADAAETAEAWRTAMSRRDGPVALILTRQKLPVLPRESLGAASGVSRGGYVLFDPPGAAPRAIIIATGSEVHTALAAAKQLTDAGTGTRVVSLPSWELFAQQPPAFRESVLPAAVRARVTVEAAASFGWQRWAGDGGEIIGLDHFGASAPAERLFQEFGFSAEHIVAAVQRVLKRGT